MPEYLGPSTASGLFSQCHKEVLWEQTWISFYGKSHPVPRLVSWHGEKGVGYSYSGQYFQADGWSPGLKKIRDQLEKDLRTPFNSVLANYYKEGKNHMGWHCDNEPELGKRPVIASLSLGASRRFLFRSKARGQREKSKKLDLPHGSLLVMLNDFQENWEHRVPPTQRQVEGRINLTFRFISKKL